MYAMSEMPIVVLQERLFSFPGPGTGTQALTVVERIDLLQWRELTLRVRVHSHSLAASSNSIAVALFPQSWTEEDPGQIFVGPTAAATVTISSSTTSPALLTTGVTTLGANGVAALGLLRVSGIRAGAGTMNATISVDISPKEA